MAEPHDVAIVGAGPAGQAAALALAGRGLRIAVLDEQVRAGGQILRQPPAASRVSGWLPGRSYLALKNHLAAFEALSEVDWRGGMSVLGIAPATDAHALTIAGPAGVETLPARHVLIATGCQDLAVPLPGWTLPGVHATGGIQAMLKGQQVVPGERFVLAGTHPLQLIVAAQLVLAGAEVAAVLFAQARSAMIAPLLAAPIAAARRWSDMATLMSAMRTLAKARVPVRYGVRLARVEGDTRVVGVTTSDGDYGCDTVGLCFGFVPQSTLPRMAGVAVRGGAPAGGFACVADDWQRSSIDRLWVAGETSGVAGAAIAAAEGAVAGIGMARACDTIDDRTAHALAAPHRHALARLRPFAALLDRIADPRGHFPELAHDTLICRCEDVPLSAIDAARGVGSANAIKLATRCGMGLCQGRNCEPTLLRITGAKAGFAQRFPARPVAIGDLV